MVCDNCRERESVLKLVQVIDGTPKELHLCERCAAEKGVESAAAAPSPAIGELLHKVQQQLLVGVGGGATAAGDAASAAARDAVRCTFCSATLADFRATGRLGCPHCYEAFEASLRELLRRVHGSARHTGRVYEPPRTDVADHGGTLGELRDRLKRAIEAEQFELAADIRDRIRVLE